MNHYSLMRVAIVAMLVAIAIGGCQPEEKPSVAELIVQAESIVTTAAEAVGDAVRLGRIEPNSEAYARIYAGLQAASLALDGAWTAYRSGDLTGADTARESALSAYMAIRPLIQEATQ